MGQIILVPGSARWITHTVVRCVGMINDLDRLMELVRRRNFQLQPPCLDICPGLRTHCVLLKQTTSGPPERPDMPCG